MAVIGSVGRFGPDAKDTELPILRKLKLNPYMEVRNAAAAAFDQIDK